MRRTADDDLEPIPLSDAPPLAPHEEPEEPAGPEAGSHEAPGSAGHTRVLRDRFLVALAVVVAVALIALAVELRAIARDTAHDADCSEALVAIVASPSRSGADLRARVEAQLQTCLGPDATLPSAGS